MNIEHIESLNTIPKLEKAGFEGTDVSLDIALFEYGLIWKQLDPDTWIFVYGIKAEGCNYVSFDRCSLKASDFESDYDWIDKKSVEETCGRKLADLNLPAKISDLHSYYGVEEIFGSSYWEGFSVTNEEEVKL